MKAIETQYKGYRFRSRTEARWAVFFEALDVDWVYEPEGFVLEDGTHYLPDFYLPQHRVWLEIKGSHHEEPPGGDATHGEFATQKGEPLVVASGLPEYAHLGDSCYRLSSEMIAYMGKMHNPTPDRLIDGAMPAAVWASGCYRYIHSNLYPEYSLFPSELCELPKLHHETCKRQSPNSPGAKHMLMRFKKRNVYLSDLFFRFGSGTLFCCTPSRPALESPIFEALCHARGARFEHGETPAV